MFVASIVYRYFVLLTIATTSIGSVIEIDIYYPQTNMRIMGDAVAFDLLVSSACYGPGPECPGSMDLPPWGAFNSTYFVYDSDRVDSNHWKKTVIVNADIIGDVFVLITGHADWTTYTYSVTSCDALYVHNPYCYQTGVAWKVSVLSSTEAYALSLYPSFGHISGVIDTWASDFYSPELNNSREIIIFKPNSFVQNWLSRVMKVIIVNDGMIDVVNGYVINGGLDTGNWPVRIQTCIIEMIDY
jgi:hypothetical protein